MTGHMIVARAATLMAVATVAPQAAAKTVIDPMIGNVLVADYGPKGSVSFTFKADGSFSFVHSDGYGASGHWIADDQYVCTIVTNPAPKLGEADRCERVSSAGKKVGDSWQIVDSYGETATLTIKKAQ